MRIGGGQGKLAGSSAMTVQVTVVTQNGVCIHCDLHSRHHDDNPSCSQYIACAAGHGHKAIPTDCHLCANKFCTRSARTSWRARQ